MQLMTDFVFSFFRCARIFKEPQPNFFGLLGVFLLMPVSSELEPGPHPLWMNRHWGFAGNLGQGVGWGAFPAG